MSYRFEWAVGKARANLAKHGISFDRREILVGHSINDRLLLVCFTERTDEIIRIVNARLPTAKERNDYEENVENWNSRQ